MKTKSEREEEILNEAINRMTEKNDSFDKFVEGALWADANPCTVVEDWISVLDRCPPCNDNTWDAYLVRTDEMTRSQPKGAMYVAIYDKDGFHVLSHASSEKRITHWMKLPGEPLIQKHNEESKQKRI